MSLNKYHARRTDVDGIEFHSKAEADRYSELKLLAMSGEIKDLETQVKFPLVVNEIKIATYIADFVYRDCATNSVVVEDSKGFRTRDYRLKKKLMLALYKITIFETGGN